MLCSVIDQSQHQPKAHAFIFVPLEVLSRVSVINADHYSLEMWLTKIVKKKSPAQSYIK